MTNHEAALAQMAGLRAEHLLFWARRSYEQVHHLRPRRYGISSDAMIDYALGLRGEPGIILYPKDTDDLQACERAYQTAPEDLRPLLEPLMDKYRAYVDQYYEHTPGCQMRKTPPEGYPFKTFSCDCRGIRVRALRNG